MKKFIVFLILFIPADSLFGLSSVWKVSSEGSVLYLGGTVHILRQEDYPLPVEFDFAYSESGTIVFETDIGKLSDPEVAQRFLAEGVYKDGRSLKTILKPDVYTELENLLAGYLVPIDSVKYFKPGMIVAVLTALTFQESGESAEGVDLHFFSMAEIDQKKINYLETVDEQIETFLNMGIGNENEFILYSMKDLENTEDNLIELIDDWRNGTWSAIEYSIYELENNFSGTYKSLVVDRNNTWLRKISKYLQNNETEFILFGSLHLHGQDGILNRLRQQGFTVEQVLLNREGY